ncbi:MAG: helix-turn-helix domain-containing protein, partial [Spongiibacteraceae bacterium]
MIKTTQAHQKGQGNDDTRQALLAAARKLFAEHGYHNVGVRDFAAAAGLTRGALYYYFPDKESVFLAVLDSIQKKRIAEAAARHRAPDRPDLWTEFRRDIQIALDDAFDREIQRILFIDGPAVLGWARWRELDTQYGLGV